MDTQHNQTESIVAIRANLLELIAVAVGVALGVNLLAGGVLLQLGWSGSAIGALGASFIILGCIFLVARAAPRISRQFSFEGVLPVIRKTHEVIPIDRYEFAEETARHVRALAAENKALARAWSDNSLSAIDIDKDGRVNRKSSPAVKLAREVLEYFVLNKLSLHLSGHFHNNPRINDTEITTIGRRDIPSVLLENRFLELFSKPMEEREAFSLPDGSEVAHKIVSAIGKGGAIFDQFELILPRGTHVSRADAQSICVQTKRFSMNIEVVFDGFATNLPRRFEELYLGRGFREVDAYQVNLEVGVKFKLWALFTATGWEYYQWLDSFLDRIGEAFSFDRFLRDIGWNTAVSVATVTRRRADSSAKIAEVPANKRPHPTAEEDESSRG